ncbi:MAG: LPS export ABC transporter periplasmic protein LptC [Elusimicrobiaceae bacterium]|nr:LPS export ABC transporter periplasmic protein LptC [Elusimicrobiaceae bacterium]
MKRFWILLIGMGWLPISLGAQERVLPAPPDEGFIFFSANQAEIEPESNKVSLEGDVTLKQQTPDGYTRTITAEQLTFDESNTQISSQGPIRIEDGKGGLVTGNNVSFNYTTNDFQADHLTTDYPPLRVLSAQEISSKNGKKILRKATVTCCDKPDPHYTISVGKLSISPTQRVFGTNAVLRLNDIPVLYLPVFWRSLDSQKPWTTYVEFTQSNKIGFGVQTTTVFPRIWLLRPKLDLDYYTKSGLGIGAQLTAVPSEKLRGTGEFYYIDDHADYEDFALNSSKRWGIQGGYLWEMYDSSNHFNNPSGALYQFQTQFRMVSDPYFYDSFFRSNPYIFMPDQDTNFSLSRQTRRTTLRASYQQKDLFVWSKQKYMAQQRTLPEIKWSILPFNDPWLKTASRFDVDFTNTSTLQYDQNQIPDEGPYKRQMHAQWITEKSLRLNRYFTLLPRVFYDQTVTFEDEKYENKDAWVSRVGGDVNLQTHSILGSTDIGYEFTKRLSTGTLSSDQKSLDKGIERNRIYLKNYYLHSSGTYVRFETGFNLSDSTINLRTGYLEALPWDHLKTRIEPLVLETGFHSSDGKIQAFIQDRYDITRKNINFIAQSYFHIKQHSFGLGLNNFADYIAPESKYTTNADRYTFTTSWGIHPASGVWAADMGIAFSFFRSHFDSFNKFIRFSRTFHDARIEATVRDRNNNLSFAVRFNILCGAGNRAKTSQQTQDTYWYPWRKEGDLRD